MNKDGHRAHKSEPNESGIVDRADGRDTPEHRSTQKTDSREDASHPERTQIGACPSTSTAGPQADNTADDHLDNDTTADTRIEAASKLRTLADDLERAARHSAADGVDVSVHVTVEETFRGSWGDD
ncbi:hypothetical protein [Haloarcula amylolytica]|uniref:Uncharacterized protein n=1 Tax=Haloarcula amylolytica JCM 13557 TaxID=1227452 RepID=M0KBD3_9EURY|nr:hypothetical protein [Haloarcula amylolytica]EMA17155.1 hypothetical protein C442_17835 [Haloarcula amylolytica JCM 13557]